MKLTENGVAAERGRLLTLNYDAFADGKTLDALPFRSARGGVELFKAVFRTWRPRTLEYVVGRVEFLPILLVDGKVRKLSVDFDPLGVGLWNVQAHAVAILRADLVWTKELEQEIREEWCLAWAEVGCSSQGANIFVSPSNEERRKAGLAAAFAYAFKGLALKQGERKVVLNRLRGVDDTPPLDRWPDFALLAFFDSMFDVDPRGRRRLVRLDLRKGKLKGGLQ